MLHSPNKSAPSDSLLRFLELHRLQETLKTEEVGVAKDGRLVETRAHHLWLQ